MNARGGKKRRGRVLRVTVPGAVVVLMLACVGCGSTPPSSSGMTRDAARGPTVAVTATHEGLNCTVTVLNCGQTGGSFVDSFERTMRAFDGCPAWFSVRAVLADGTCITETSASTDGWWDTHIFDSQLLDTPQPVTTLRANASLTRRVDLRPILETAYGDKLRASPPSGWQAAIKQLGVRVTVFTSATLDSYVERQEMWSLRVPPPRKKS